MIATRCAAPGFRWWAEAVSEVDAGPMEHHIVEWPSPRRSHLALDAEEQACSTGCDRAAPDPEIELGGKRVPIVLKPACTMRGG